MQSDSFPSVVDGCLRCVMIGDVVGKPGMRIACSAAKWLRQRLKCDFLMINAENAADGTGLRIREFDRLLQAGYDVVTLGDHVYRKKEIMERLRTSDRLLRPLNYPADSAGAGWTTVTTRNGIEVTVISLLGRVFMRPVDCPFTAFTNLIEQSPNRLSKIRLVDFHGEATSDKQSFGWLADGKISAVFGTHTHVATADEQILPKGSGYHTDVGMTGPFKSVLGRDIEAVLQATIKYEPTSFDVASEDVRITGCYVDIDIQSGLCQRIERLQWREETILQWDAADALLATKM
jgi:2',3'-cyclic-nucleotide 2'-phosphodiesterase